MELTVQYVLYLCIAHFLRVSLKTLYENTYSTDHFMEDSLSIYLILVNRMILY